MPAAAAVSERAGSGAQGSAGRAGSGAASAARGARAQPATARGAGSGWGRAGRGVQAWVRVRASPRPGRPDFPSRSFPSHPRRRPSPGFLTRRAAKIAQGRISTSRRPDRAGQLGSSPRPTAEGPGSGRARSLGVSPGSSELCPPPLDVFRPGRHRWVVLQVETPAPRVGLLGIVPVPAVLTGDGNTIISNSSSWGARGGGLHNPCLPTL